jgi:tyrosine-protein kinase Etk/Wzc
LWQKIFEEEIMQEKEVNILKLWESIWGNRSFIIIFCLVVAIITAGISLILPKWYKASASILPPGSGSGAFGALSSGLSSLGFGGLLDNSSGNTTRLLAIAKSRNLREKVIDKYNFFERYKADYRDDALKMLGKNLVVTTGREDEITITFYDKDQEIVAEVVNYVLNQLDSLEIMFSQEQARDNREFINSRIAEVTDSLYTVQKELLAFMSQNEIVSIPDQVSAGISQAALMQAEIAALEIELQTSQNMYGADNLIISQLEDKLRLTKEKYNEFFNSPKSQLFLELQKVPGYQMDYLTMERKMQYLATLLEFLGPQYENAKIESYNNLSRLQVLDKAHRPDRRYKPKRAFMVILATFTAFCASLFIIYLKSAVREARLEEHSY